MNRYILILLSSIFIISCTSTLSEEIELVQPEESSSKTKMDLLEQEYGNVIPNFKRYKYGSIKTAQESNITILGLNNDNEISIFYISKDKQIIMSSTFDIDEKDRGKVYIDAVFQPNNIKEFNATALTLRYLGQEGRFAYVSLYFPFDNKIQYFKSFLEDEWSAWERKALYISDGYLYFVENEKLIFYKMSDLSFIRSYNYWYDWGYDRGSTALIFNNAQDVITIGSSTYSGYYSLVSTKLGLDNGIRKENWNNPTSIYLPRQSLKTGEKDERKFTLKLDGNTILVSVLIESKRWDGNNNLVDKVENRVFKFSLADGVGIE